MFRFILLVCLESFAVTCLVQLAGTEYTITTILFLWIIIMIPEVLYGETSELWSNYYGHDN